MNFSMERHILVVLPHPDDEAFGLSGTLAKHIKNGTQVTYACLTLGEMGRNMGIPPFATRVTLPSIRKGELEESCRAIGIQDLRMLGFHDKTIEFEDQDLLDAKINDMIKEVRPSLIFTFYPGYSVHPDHDATGAAVIRTVGRLPKDERPTVYCIAFAKNLEQGIGHPDVLIDVKEFLPQKVQSILAHRSQFQVAELLNSTDHTSKEIQDRFGTERFWTYSFE
ncbi:MAG: deacetylase [Brevibacillus sp.]|nr:deacetylase [Brevibacillus sp.]